MGFPEELKKLNRWVGYRLVPDKDGGKPKKVPINAVTGQNAKSNDPATWCDYRTAKDAADQYGYNGIGFMFVKEDGFVQGLYVNSGFTIKIEAITRELLAEAKQYLDRQIDRDFPWVYFHLSQGFLNRFNYEDLK